ncbi:hypothetical protein M3P21_02110 [Ruegeria sp. 2012CJ41-6]|uniref:Uncharacterized protein n=1 Tax=Ruegeria spongiae TaxID=2942209 RepID=A0ABT0PXH3_9RHOB|nr:hypothetical protein [Ruegeria spongiae]MCL6282309.1 hypothetical protein [Ruegeria spongiae]
MKKLIALINVIAWAGFWAFGYIALTSQDLTTAQLVIAAILALAGLVTGIAAYVKLARGRARRTSRLDAAAREKAQQEWGK